MKLVLVTLLTTLCLFTVACDSPQNVSRDAIAGAKGVLDTAQQKYKDACSLDATQQACVVIHKGVAAENLAIDALEEYCGGSAAPGKQDFLNGGVCSPDKSVEPKLQQAINNLNQIVSDVKGLIQ